MSSIIWLPPLVLFENFQGDWVKYEDALYEFFKKDFIHSTPTFLGEKLGLKRHPLRDGKEATFWHFIRSGPIEEERQPDISRCERIRWPRPSIDNAQDSSIKVWENTRGCEKRICIWIEQENYLIVLARRNGYLLPWTAYCDDSPHFKRKLQKEYEAFHRTKKAEAAH